MLDILKPSVLTNKDFSLKSMAGEVLPSLKACDKRIVQTETSTKWFTTTSMTMLPEEYIGNCARSMDWKAQTGGSMSIHLLMLCGIVLGSYYPDRHDSGTQQAIYYPS